MNEEKPTENLLSEDLAEKVGSLKDRPQKTKSVKKSKVTKTKEAKDLVDEAKKLMEIKKDEKPKKEKPKRQRIPVDLSKVEFAVGDKVEIWDRGCRDHEKEGKIVAIDKKLESPIYTVLLDIHHHHNNPRKVNTRQKTIGLFKSQMKKRNS